jgi:cell division protein FtsW
MASRWLAVDKTLFFCAVALVGLGLVMVYSASFPTSQRDWNGDLHFLARQLVATVVGLLALLAGLTIDYRIYRKPTVVGAAVLGAAGLLIAVLMMPTIAGVHRWISLAGFNVQPSEIAKLVVIVFLASYLSRKDDQINDIVHGLAPALLVVGGLAFLIAIEPDLGTAASLVMIAVVMLFIAGLSWKFVAQVGAIGIALATIQVLRTGYQARRITAFLDPWADAQGSGYQTVQSLIAVGNGGVTGVGLAESSQTRMFFLPFPYTDFIYAVVAEELGFIGAAAVVLAFMVMLWRGMRAALRAPDRFGFYLGVGLTTFLVLQAMLNMSIVVNLLPTTGIPLPLISYGGSSMVVCCAAIGVLLNLSQHAHR